MAEPSSDQQNDQTLEANAYAIAYRLLGDRPAARAVAGIAAQQVRLEGGLQRPDWLVLLVEHTVRQAVGPVSLGVGTAPEPDDEPADDDERARRSLRAALRRRLERATPEERVAGALVHLAGYPVDFVAEAVGQDPARTAELAGVIAPPPGVRYRDLGDPELTGTDATPPRRRRATRRPHWTTLAVLAVVVALVVVATQVTGPRPSFGPPLDEGGLAATGEPAPTADPVSGTADRSPS